MAKKTGPEHEARAVNMHKRLAEGQKLTGQALKKGGRAMPHTEPRKSAVSKPR